VAGLQRAVRRMMRGILMGEGEGERWRWRWRIEERKDSLEVRWRRMDGSRVALARSRFHVRLKVA
jgi:PAS domain-containing protein